MNYRTLTTLTLAIIALCGAQGRGQSGQETLTLPKGGKVVINSGGPVTVNGWDRDTVEARAGDAGEEPVGLRAAGDQTRPVVVVSFPPERHRGRRDVPLVVKVPRHADLEVNENWRGDGNVEVSDVDGAVVIKNGRGDAIARRVGPLTVHRNSGNITASNVKGQVFARSLSGDVTIEKTTGLVEVVATSGSIIVRDAGGDVRANSASGDIDIHCAKGRADVNTASGTLTLAAIGGGVDANTASGDVTLNTRIGDNGRYRLKTISGEVELTMQPDPPGFTATLTTYTGEIATDFPLKVDGIRGPQHNRKIIGVYGDGGAQILLDSFSGSVRIIKAAQGALKECK